MGLGGSTHPKALLLCCHLWLPEVLRGTRGPETWGARKAARGPAGVSTPASVNWDLGTRLPEASPELHGGAGHRAGQAQGREVPGYAEGPLWGKEPRARLLLPRVSGAGQGICRH